jgi:LCP family protein required for cell wall assembly
MAKKSKISLAILAVVAAAGIAGFLWFRNLTGKVFLSPVMSLFAATSSSTLKRPEFENLIAERLYEKKPINVLLLGYGGGDHDGTYLTDTIMVASIDPKLSKVTLISIPRDIWVDGKKVNSFYSLSIKEGAAKAGRSAMDAVGKVTGLTLDRFVSVSFSGFKKTIDTLGGVDVKVDVTFDDFQYPVTGREDDLCGHDPSELPAIAASASATVSPELIFPCRYKTLHFDAGITHMNGETALEYVRSRHSAQDGSDFGRARRQRNLMVAVKQKMMSVNFIPNAIPFINSLGDDVRTDISLDEVRLILTNASLMSKYQISNFAITDENYVNNSHSQDGQFILVPKAGIDNWSELHKGILDQLSGKPVPVKLAVMVENGTKTPKLASLVAEKINGAGIKIAGTRNANEANTATTRITVFDPNVSGEELAKLKALLGIENAVASEGQADGNYNILVTLGGDFQIQ